MKIARTIGMACAALLVAGFAFGHEFKVGSLEIVHPNARAMVPGAQVGGGYLTIANHGTTDDRLVSITSPVSDDVQMHEMSMTDGVMKMRQLKDGITIAAGKTVKLASGGMHVMFMKVKQPFKEGDMVPATLHFEKAGDLNVTFMVGPANGGGAMQHDMGDMKGMKM